MNFKHTHGFADFGKFNGYFIGLEKFNEKMQETLDIIQKSATSFPPYNLKKVSDNKYVVEMAVAGFGKQDIEITLDDNKMIIKGNTSNDDEGTTLHKGIADRAFTRTFSLADNVVIENAQMTNGILKIWLDHIIPESNKPKKIEIEETPAVTTKKTKE